MKKIILSFMAVLVSIALPTSVKAADINTSSSSTTAHVKILSPISINNNVVMDFGVVARTASTAGTITLPGVTGNPTLSCTNGIIPVSTSQATAAKFTVSGNGGSAYKIVYGATTSIPLGSGDNALKLDLSGPTGTSDLPSSGTIPGNFSASPFTIGTDVFYVGGILTIPSAAAYGDYTSSAINVTVAYD